MNDMTIEQRRQWPERRSTVGCNAAISEGFLFAVGSARRVAQPA